MSKVSYANLKNKINKNTEKETVKKFSWNGETIEVLQYLPIEDKADLINITLQNSYEDGIYSPLKIDVYFHLYIVYLYTNLSFTDKQKEDELKIYDTLQSSGLLAEILTEMDDDEYNTLYGYLNNQIDVIMKYKTTAASVLNKFIDDLPANAEAALSIVDNFDPDKFQAVKDFAEAANGGRTIG